MRKKTVFSVWQGQSLIALVFTLNDARVIARRWVPQGQTDIVRSVLTEHVKAVKRTRKAKAA